MPDCAACKQECSGGYIEALEKCWHPDCFACAQCGVSFGEGAFVVQDDKPMHEACYDKIREHVTCGSCEKEVEAGQQYLSALEKTWHLQCFVCTVCKKSFPNGKFYQQDGRPVHEECHTKAAGSVASQVGAAGAHPGVAPAPGATKPAAGASPKRTAIAGEPEFKPESVSLRHVDTPHRAGGGLSAPSTSPRHATPSSSSPRSADSANAERKPFQHYKYDELRLPGSKLTVNEIDVKTREEYLTDDDFALIFKMNRLSYSELPQWKKDNERKRVGLY